MSRRILITGMGAVCSIGLSVDQVTASLRAGRGGIARGEATGSPVAHSISAVVDRFSLSAQLDAIPGLGDGLHQEARRAVRRGSFSMQATVIAALQAWASAELERTPIEPEDVGIVVANDGGMQRHHHDAFVKYREGPEYFWPRYALQGLATDPVGTISDVLSIRGEGFAVSGASASGNLAIIRAAELIEVGRVQACLVVGVLTDLSPAALQAFHNVGALGGKRPEQRPDHACRPFDRDHDGFIPGQGAGCLILESEESARRRGAAGVAAYLGGASLLDGNRHADPSESGEVRVMQRCLERAELTTGDIDYINAHGTSSPLGDQTEARAIERTLGGDAGRVWINSTKSLLGHCLFSAGVLEAIACAVQIDGEFVHPNLNLSRPIHDGLRFCGPAAHPARIRAVLSNSFGFGGINTTIALGAGDRQ